MSGNQEQKKLLLERLVKEQGSFFANSKYGELFQCIVESVEKPLIEMVLEKTFGNKIKAAKILGINRNTLHARIKRFGINVASYKKI